MSTGTEGGGQSCEYRDRGGNSPVTTGTEGEQSCKYRDRGGDSPVSTGTEGGTVL